MIDSPPKEINPVAKTIAIFEAEDDSNLHPLVISNIPESMPFISEASILQKLNIFDNQDYF